MSEAPGNVFSLLRQTSLLVPALLFVSYLFSLLVVLVTKGRLIDKLGEHKTPRPFSYDLEAQISVFRVCRRRPFENQIKEKSPSFYYSVLISKMLMIAFVFSIVPIHTIAADALYGLLLR